jgi:hypothetical protein
VEIGGAVVAAPSLLGIVSESTVKKEGEDAAEDENVVKYHCDYCRYARVRVGLSASDAEHFAAKTFRKAFESSVPNAQVRSELCVPTSRVSR